MKFSIEDLFKHPIIILLVVITGTGMMIFASQNFASIAQVNEKVTEVKSYVDDRHGEVRGQLQEIKSTVKEIDKNILEIYKAVKYQEGKNESK